LCDDTAVRTPFFIMGRRFGALGMALTAYDIWRRIPPSQRKWLLETTRTHGPRLASKAAEHAKNARKPKP
jgi:hypothetical protein